MAHQPGTDALTTTWTRWSRQMARLSAAYRNFLHRRAEPLSDLSGAVRGSVCRLPGFLVSRQAGDDGHIMVAGHVPAVCSAGNLWRPSLVILLLPAGRTSACHCDGPVAGALPARGANRVPGGLSVRLRQPISVQDAALNPAVQFRGEAGAGTTVSPRSRR